VLTQQAPAEVNSEWLLHKFHSLIYEKPFFFCMFRNLSFVYKQTLKNSISWQDISFHDRTSFHDRNKFSCQDIILWQKHIFMSGHHFLTGFHTYIAYCHCLHRCKACTFSRIDSYLHIRNHI